MSGKNSIIATLLALMLTIGIAQADSLKTQLEHLIHAQGISIKNLHLVQDGPPLRLSGTPDQQLKRLLSDYNFVQLSNKQGDIEKVIITSIKRYDNTPPPAVVEKPKTDASYAIKTTRSGSHHLVKAELSGPYGTKLKANMLIDTGATTLVLPASLQSALGFTDRNLQPGYSETANGRVEIMQGKLKSVVIGKAQADNVDVSFIADDKLQSSGLLGMSFLGRFQMTFDDASNQIILKPY
ncbi:retropepsin-like aspartic protease [Methylotuvimicrobium sp. KM2]|jgi:aspartyl protease family protein|uniref:retropepsin-like aspartic protease family protein n=1 Tax=Methylotuvimicrobium sp. KM2 TaxID=3133976 RepID=UPI003100ECB7